jgi:SAM-dependent methyltransferase|tara:strand:+ start:219 stop:815 length:597 start_codon:yes stop_codon:yes gene_type:complete
MMVKPFSQACENNRQPIFQVLQAVLASSRHVLELGSGTGQHAVYFAPQLPHLIWQTSDLAVNHEAINSWIDEHPAENLRRPLVLDVDQQPWPVTGADAVFTANTCHIMSWQSVISLFAGLEKLLQPGAHVVIYGPFNYGGEFTSDSNARFDQMLKQNAPYRGIRDFEAINGLADEAGLTLLDDHAMPANNRLLVWQRR